MVMTCRGCGTDFEGRRIRFYCSNACQRAHQRRELVAAWLETGAAVHAGSSRRHYIRMYLHEQQEGRCALCGIEDSWQGLALVLTLDHIDGDSTNNERANLRLICPNCDSQLPTYKARNRGRGRHYRRERYANGQSY